MRDSNNIIKSKECPLGKTRTSKRLLLTQLNAPSPDAEEADAPAGPRDQSSRPAGRTRRRPIGA